LDAQTRADALAKVIDAMPARFRGSRNARARRPVFESRHDNARATEIDERRYSASL
jgi:hypothetical protein